LGLAEVTYEGGIVIYVNYNNFDVEVSPALTLEANSYQVVKP
jgi:hypothetical protein